MYFSHLQIVKESFLEDINGILNTGEVRVGPPGTAGSSPHPPPPTKTHTPLPLGRSLTQHAPPPGPLPHPQVANLFNAEETGQMMEALAKPCQEAGVNAGSPAEVL